MKEMRLPGFRELRLVLDHGAQRDAGRIVDKLHEGFKAAMASPEGRAYQATRPLVEISMTPREMQAFVVSGVRALQDGRESRRHRAALKAG